MKNPVNLAILATLLLAMFFHSGCQPSVAKDQFEQYPGTRAMGKILSELYQTLDFSNSTYIIPDEKLQKIRSEIPSSPLGRQLELRFRLATFLLYSGDPEGSVREFETLRSEIQEKNLKLPPQQYGVLLKNMALAYLRLGEETNCIGQANEASCIIPLAPEGIYPIKSAATTASSLLKELLQMNPQDYGAVWLLNLTHMNLGDFPQAVPEPFRMPAEVFKGQLNFEKFTNIASSAGVSDGRLSGGCVIEDLNHDGWLDLVVSSWGFDDPLKVYLNDGTGKFRDFSNQPGLSGINGGLNLVPADYNNDGNLDILVLRGAWHGELGKVPNSLLMGHGDGTFEDVTMTSGLLSYHPTQTATWLDADLDGNIDLFIANETTRPDFPHPCEFFKNNGDGTFTEMAEKAGLQNLGFYKGCASGDINNDGYPDIILSGFRSKNVLLLNNTPQTQDRQINFRDITAQAGIAEPLVSFPTWFFDFNNDGLEDIFICGFGDGKSDPVGIFYQNMMGKKLGMSPALYLNQGNNQFVNAANALGLTDAVYAMGSNFGDLNYDGFPDFYLATGSPEFGDIFPNRMYLNLAGKKVEDVTYSGGFGHVQKGHAVGFGDLDNDGDQDIYTVAGGAYAGDFAPNILFSNPGNKNHKLYVRLVGTKSNSAAIGARLECTAKHPDGSLKTIYKRIGSGGSFGASTLRCEIGLGNAQMIQSLKITWPHASQSQQIFTNLKADQSIIIREGLDSIQLEMLLKKPQL